jgi:hypothetical protein
LANLLDYCDFLFPIVSTCVLSQSCGHLLLNDVLHFAISMNLKLKEENQIVPSFENLMDVDSIVTKELSLLAYNSRKKRLLMCWILSFHS